MKIDQLLIEGISTIRAGAQIHQFTNSPLYWTNDYDEDFYIIINRGLGKISSITDRNEYRFEGNIAYGKEVVGTVTIGVAEDMLTVTRLIDIELLKGKKKQGCGSKAVTLLANCTSNGVLIINDIQKKARGFWNKLGAEYFNDLGREDIVSAKVTVQ